MRDGRLQQVGPPAEVYENPANLFVAGIPRHAEHEPARPGGSSAACCTAGALRLVVPGAPDGDVVVGIRPEGSSPAADGRRRDPSFEVVVSHVEALGNENLVHGSGRRRRATPPSRSCFRAPPSVLAPEPTNACACGSTRRSCCCSTRRPSSACALSGPVVRRDDRQRRGLRQ